MLRLFTLAMMRIVFLLELQDFQALVQIYLQSQVLPMMNRMLH